ncbi:MAG: hypothetical protein AAF492_22415, partial [Verrucomicrobiota bacterium]
MSSCAKTYHAECKIFINKDVIPEELHGSQDYMEYAREIAFSTNLLAQVIKDLTLTDYSPKSLKKTIRWIPTKGTQVVTIRVSLNDLEKAARVANQVAGVLREVCMKEKNQRMRKEIDILDMKLKAQNEKFDKAENELFLLEGRLGLDSESSFDELPADAKATYKESVEKVALQRQLLNELRTEIGQEGLITVIPRTPIELMEPASPQRR